MTSGWEYIIHRIRILGDFWPRELQAKLGGGTLNLSPQEGSAEN